MKAGSVTGGSVTGGSVTGGSVTGGSATGGSATGARATMFEVERERTWRIWLLFAVLVALFFAGVWAMAVILGLALSSFLLEPSLLRMAFSLPGLGVLFTVAVVVGVVYWLSSRIEARERLLKAMCAASLDPADRYHQRLADLVDEVRMATGSRHIDCVVVPTVGMNTFAFSDFAGGGTIGVTEGALARLTRQQLEAVVAHETAHIVSGDALTATVACLLFGIYSSARDKLGDVAGASAAERDSVGLVPLFLLIQGVLALLELASAIVSAAISRQREFKADAAAVRYTRDPLSLAQALQTISRHTGGAGFIAAGLSALCIRPAGGGFEWLGRLAATHPPMEQRITALLRMANVNWVQFAQDAEKAERSMTEREHYMPAPALVTATVPQATGSAPATSDSPTGPACPSCRSALTPTLYEGLEILACRVCGGRLASQEQVERIIARREIAFTDEQRRLAALVRQEGDRLRRKAVLSRGARQILTPCPLCGKAMLRRHYNLQYAVEVDICMVCDRVWFEKDELEVLQLLVEDAVE